MVDYTNYDYDEIVSRVTEILQNTEGWGDAYDSSMGQALIRMISDVTDNLHYMLERRTIENYLFTAKTQSAVFARAGELGYRAKRIQSNFGELTLSLQDSEGVAIQAAGEIKIPERTSFTYNSQTFTSTEDVYIEEDETSVIIPVKEGTPDSITFAQSEFSDDDTVTIENYIDIEENSLKVVSAGIEFQDVTINTDDSPARRAMSFVGSNENFYDIRYEVEGMRIILGDGTFGAKPLSDLEVSFIRVDSISSPVNTTGNEFSTDFVPLDQYGTNYTFVVTNSSKIRRGKLAESLEDVKENARTYIKTNGRAVTTEDIDYWVKEANIGGVLDARSLGEKELNTVVHNINNVYINYLKDDATELTVEEETKLRSYLSSVLMSTIHPVFRKVDNLLVQARLDASKNKDLEMSDTEFYSRLKTFMEDYFKLREGSIGRGVQHSEIVRDLHKQKVRRNGVDYDLVDYVKLDLDAVYPLDIPLSVKSANVTIDDNYSAIDGDEFVLILQNIVCLATIAAGDDNITILDKMRDVINDTTPYVAKVEFDDIAVDGFGNPLPIEIDAGVGEGLLVGTDTPFREPTELIEPPAVGSTLAKYVLDAEAVQVQHFYYSQKQGRRPLIPLRVGTSISFTAPTDTDIQVYTRTDMSDPSTETLASTITAGQTYSMSFSSGEHSLQFEYVNDSQEDVVVDINYPSVENFAFGLNITTPDSFGTFTLQNTSGDISGVVNVSYNLGLPPVRRNIDTESNQIQPASLEIITTNGSVVFSSRADGRFIYPDGNLVPSGRIDYITSSITVPEELTNGSYYVRYRQNKYQNIKTDETSALVLMDISSDINNQNTFSRINIEVDV